MAEHQHERAEAACEGSPLRGAGPVAEWPADASDAPRATDTDATPTVALALQQARALGVERFDAQVLLQHLLGRSRAWLITHDDAPLDAAQSAQWLHWLTRRRAGVPVAYLTGTREFHGLTLQVTPAVLDPRPDTEVLVDWALDCMAQRQQAGQVLDLGTGSGAIALALKAARGDWQVHAADRSAAALAVARANGERLALPIDWHLGSWFDALAPRDEARPATAHASTSSVTGAETAGENAPRFDLIVSNPPYIAAGDPHLTALVHEPLEALVAGNDGLDDIRHLIAQAPAFLTADGWLLLEHGHDQADAVAACFLAAGWRAVGHRLDLAGLQRCTGALRPAAKPCESS